MTKPNLGLWCKCFSGSKVIALYVVIIHLDESTWDQVNGYAFEKLTESCTFPDFIFFYTHTRIPINLSATEPISNSIHEELKTAEKFKSTWPKLAPVPGMIRLNGAELRECPPLVKATPTVRCGRYSPGLPPHTHKHFNTRIEVLKCYHVCCVLSQNRPTKSTGGTMDLSSS